MVLYTENPAYTLILIKYFHGISLSWKNSWDPIWSSHPIQMCTMNDLNDGIRYGLTSRRD